MPYCLNAERVYRSVDWQQFQQDSQAKRELWQQNPTNLIMMPSLFSIEECDMDRLYEIEQAAHLCVLVIGDIEK